MSNVEDIDLFAGPGGWDEGIRPLGIRPLGIEWDTAACATARAAGHRRLQMDVSALDPTAFGDVRGLIASPPCQGFSMAGKGRGRDDAQLLLAAIPDMINGDVRPGLREQMTDPRSLFVLEPLRWALALRPDWCAFEQVPAVLPIWEACASMLRALGYGVATGILNAEQYGVPQTRRRAILVARRDGEVQLPAPTHSRYYTSDPTRLDAEVAKWVSMAEALDRDGTWAIRSNYGSGGDPSARGMRTLGQPAAAVTSKVGRNKWVAPDDWTLRRPAPTVVGTRRSADGMITGRQLPPGEGRAVGGHGWDGETTSTKSGAPATGIRVTVEQAAVLQTFPTDYPWRGTKTERYQQVGDAVPPLLARAVIAQVASANVVEVAA